MPAKDDKIHFEHKGIGRVLKDHRLAVPPNQREYAWLDEHVNELFSDFANAIANNQGAYFLGTIVLTRCSASRHVRQAGLPGQALQSILHGGRVA